MGKGMSSRSGPAPSATALRRDRDEGDWKILPAAGRQGEPPAWPLDEPTERELYLWAIEWARPQAIVWERNGQQVEVALYVRALTDAERHGAAVTARTLVRQLQESLGISVPGMLRNRWKIEESAAEAEADEPTATEAPTSARDRLRMVAGGGG